VAGSCEYGGEPSGSVATELSSYIEAANITKRTVPSVCILVSVVFLLVSFAVRSDT
jgi:hypothetical protein